MLKGDPHLPSLPLDPNTNDLFDCVRDGILLWCVTLAARRQGPRSPPHRRHTPALASRRSKLINKAVPETIDERAVNIPKAGKSLNIYQITENQNLVIGAAKAIGCVVVNIGPDDLINGSKRVRATALPGGGAPHPLLYPPLTRHAPHPFLPQPHLVLGVIWQIVKIQLLSAVNLKQHPELVRSLRGGPRPQGPPGADLAAQVRLLDEDAGEELGDLLRLPPEQVLLRWFNFHLQNANHPKRVANFGNDVHVRCRRPGAAWRRPALTGLAPSLPPQDGEAYTQLLHQIAPDVCDTRAMAESDLHERARLIIGNAKVRHRRCGDCGGERGHRVPRGPPLVAATAPLTRLCGVGDGRPWRFPASSSLRTSCAGTRA